MLLSLVPASHCCSVRAHRGSHVSMSQVCALLHASIPDCMTKTVNIDIIFDNTLAGQSAAWPFSVSKSGIDTQHLSMQGDGTAFIFQGRKDVFTLSMHAANNFPARKQKSTLDVPLPDGMEDDDYLRWCRCLPCQLPASCTAAGMTWCADCADWVFWELGICTACCYDRPTCSRMLKSLVSLISIARSWPLAAVITVWWVMQKLQSLYMSLAVDLASSCCLAAVITAWSGTQEQVCTICHSLAPSAACCFWHCWRCNKTHDQKVTVHHTLFVNRTCELCVQTIHESESMT